MGTLRNRPRRAAKLLLSAGVALAVASPLSAVPAAHAKPVMSGPAVSAAKTTQLIAPRTAASTESSAFAKHLESQYIDPDRVYSTDVRWWLGEAANTDESLLEEIQALYDAGFRGVELCMQNDNGAPNDLYAYGSKMWTHKWNLMMNKLLDLGMGVYLTSGTNWSTSNVPDLDPTSQAAMQNLTLGTGTVNAGATLTTLPAPPANAQRAGAKFVTAYAYRVVEGNTVDPDSFVDLAPQVSQGADVWTQGLSWTAPNDGTYRVFALWTQGTFQASNPSVNPSYATNYFDERGVAALREFWEDNYLKDPALRAKILEGDVQLFMDSLEMNTGTGFTWWAEDMAQEFQKRKGYDITPHLFLISGVGASFNNPYHRVGTSGTYRLGGAEDERQRIVNDYQDVLTQLYMERMLTPLKEWLNGVGIKTRAQISYGKPVEISEPIMAVDYPEAENLNQNNQVDIFRLWTGGAKLENKVLSSETSAQYRGYSPTRQQHLTDAYSQFAAGFQRTIWHIWSAGYGYGNYQWPGFVAQAPGGPYYAFGSRNPGAADYDVLNAHLGRVQQLMQTGKSRTDVGFVHQNWVHGMTFGGGVRDNNRAMNWQLAHQGVHYRSTELQDNGYTYDYFSPRFLFDDDVYFDEETKTIEQAGYKAVVLYQDWLELKSARRLLNWAKKGLKVVIVEDAASQTPHRDGKDDVLKKITDELKSLATVRTATVYDNIDYFSEAPGGYDDNVMEKLQELGVHPYAGYPEENIQLLHQVREDEDGNRYLYAFNYSDDDYHPFSHKPEIRGVRHGNTIQTDVAMEGRYIPYIIDSWTGEVTEVADYRWEDGRTVVPVDLDLHDIELMAFEKVDEEQLHVVATNGDAARATADGIAVRTTESGTLRSTLSDGTELEDEVEVPAAFDITDWDLTVQSWRPNATAGDLSRTETIGDLTTTDRKTSTAKTTIEVELETLRTWNDIPEIGRAVSGTGRYEATFDWDAGSATGAFLDFGDDLAETMQVSINGEKVGGVPSTNPTKTPVDVGGVGKPTIDDGTGTQVPLVGSVQYTGSVNWMVPVADVSDYLVDGKNEIVIEYSSTLANVQLDRGVARPEQNIRGFWKSDMKYHDFGPKQAKLVPFVEVEYTDELAETSVGADAVRGVYGRPTTVTARVEGANPTGRVEVALGDRVLGRANVGANGRARIALGRTALSAGQRKLTLRYSGDDANAAATSTVVATIQRARTTVRTAVRPRPVRAGTRASLVVRVGAVGVTPRGRVLVRQSGDVVARGQLDANGRAVIRLPQRAVGTHHFQVVSPRKRNFDRSRQAVTVRVVR